MIRDQFRPAGDAPVSQLENTLTNQELECAYRARYDLGPGYPQLDVADYIKTLYLDDSIEDLSLRFAPFWSPEKQSQVDADLESEVRSFLRVPGSVTEPIRATFSGSVALDRAFSASARIAGRHGFDEIAVITTTPCIDIMRLFLAERRDVTAHFVPSNCDGVLGTLDLDGLLSTIESLALASPRAAITVLLTSPENPTGAIWNREQLEQVCAACAKHSALLILDHCFALAGVHDSSSFPRIWDLPRLACSWIAIWDTGKTFGLNEDKLGFILSSDAEVRDAVDSALAVLQFGIARRQKLFFSELLRRAFFYGHVTELQDVCRDNLCTASALGGALAPLALPVAGSLLLLDVSAVGLDDESFRQRLLEAGVGVVAGSVFFHTDWKPSHLVRVALARRRDYFAEAFQCMISLLP